MLKKRTTLLLVIGTALSCTAAHAQNVRPVGAVKSIHDGVYGYYEASLKGVKMFPGLSPAFWLYSDGHPYPDRNEPGSVDYSEIDIVELQQADWHGPGPRDADPVNVMDHNLHARIVGEDGNIYWRRHAGGLRKNLGSFAFFMGG